MTSLLNFSFPLWIYQGFIEENIWNLKCKFYRYISVLLWYITSLYEKVNLFATNQHTIKIWYQISIAFRQKQQQGKFKVNAFLLGSIELQNGCRYLSFVYLTPRTSSWQTSRSAEISNLCCVFVIYSWYVSYVWNAGKFALQKAAKMGQLLLLCL